MVCLHESQWQTGLMWDSAGARATDSWTEPHKHLARTRVDMLAATGMQANISDTSQRGLTGRLVSDSALLKLLDLEISGRSHSLGGPTYHSAEGSLCHENADTTAASLRRGFVNERVPIDSTGREGSARLLRVGVGKHALRRNPCLARLGCRAVGAL